jgi:hypothetical protein
MGMKSASFPVFIRAKGDKELREFGSLSEVQGSVEAIDVENNEYEGWDCKAFPIQLRQDATNGFSVSASTDVSEIEALKAALNDFAGLEGVSVTLPESLEGFNRSYRAVKDAVEEARRRKPWLKRIINRL